VVTGGVSDGPVRLIDSGEALDRWDT